MFQNSIKIEIGEERTLMAGDIVTVHSDLYEDGCGDLFVD